MHLPGLAPRVALPCPGRGEGGGAHGAVVDDEAGQLQVDEVAGEEAVRPAVKAGVLEGEVPGGVFLACVWTGLMVSGLSGQGAPPTLTTYI